MCKSPNTLPNGQQVACRNCDQCVNRKVNDWIGRNIAEARTAQGALCVTLTYGRDDANHVHHERSVILTYSDVQKFVKLLRRHGHSVRYFVTGEYGSEKGRAHWHIVLYFDGVLPDWERNKITYVPEWPHGHVVVDGVNYGTVRYNAKYLLKDMHGRGQAKLGMSKKPPLGAEYFREMAEAHVAQGIAPQSLQYTFPECRYRLKAGGEAHFVFHLAGTSAQMFLTHFIETWAQRRPGQRRPVSPLVDLFEEYGRVVFDEALLRTEQERVERQKYQPRYIEKPPSREQAQALRRLREQRRETERLQDAQFGWFDAWIGEAPNEQERQKREEQFGDWLRAGGARRGVGDTSGTPGAGGASGNGAALDACPCDDCVRRRAMGRA